MKVLVTGSAGFIGMHVALRLLERGDEVVGIDNLNDYYDMALKEARSARLCRHSTYREYRVDIADRVAMERIFGEERPQRVVNLAAQAGVRYSLRNPRAYVDTNVVGFMNILEGCRAVQAEHLVYASSSSVYGGNTRMPFSEHDRVDHPVSIYAATKRANELMAHTYSHLYKLPSTGLRFFTVYGPWGRPDMALFLFTKAILEERPIDIFNGGAMQRDFTYIDDVADAVVRVVDRPARPGSAFDAMHPDPAASWAPFRILNVGNHRPVALMAYVEALEQALGLEAKRNFLPMQAGDVPATYADTTLLAEAVEFLPATTVGEGVRRFVDWYLEYYGRPSRGEARERQ